jgi:hypothetical protein
MNKYRQHAPVRSFLRWLAAALAATMVVVGCGGGGGGDDEDPTTPTIAAASATRAVVRKDDMAPLPAFFAVTVTNPGSGMVVWSSASVATLGPKENTLSLSTAAKALAVGEQTVTATITNPRNGRSAATTFSLLVLAAGADTDDDNDGLTYNQEKNASTQPGSADTDNDGLADGAEEALGTNPVQADSNSNGVNDGVELANAAGLVGSSLPARSLISTTTATSGVTVGADGLSVTFGSQLNPNCVNRSGEFSGAIYDPISSSVPGNERCAKRAVRANIGIAPGEFRYFETRRFSGPTTAELSNLGHGIITPTAQIDPYCCYFLQQDPDYGTYVNAGPPETPKPANPTPPSMTVNSIGGVFARLIQVDPALYSGLSLEQTQYYGFAVDYRDTEPVVFLVGRNAGGSMVVSSAIYPAGTGTFGNVPAMPMMHGHPIGSTAPHAAMNLGASRFHYSLAEIRDVLDGKGVANADQMVGGVGIHRWKVPAP